MIKSFRSKDTEKLFLRGKSQKIPSEIIKTSLRKLDYLNAAKNLNDLKVPPGNRLEQLKGNLSGKYSIRINEKYRIVFNFEDGNAYDVEITDYH